MLMVISLVLLNGEGKIFDSCGSIFYFECYSVLVRLCLVACLGLKTYFLSGLLNVRMVLESDV